MRIPSNAHRIITLSCVTLTALLLCTTLAWGAEYVSVKKDGVNIRSGPGTDHDILWEVFARFPLQVVKRSNNWAQVVDFENDTGWIWVPLLSKERTVIVQGDTVNMRSGPSTESPVIATVKQGVVFTPIETKDGWVKVSYKDDITGWIFSDLLWPKL